MLYLFQVPTDYIEPIMKVTPFTAAGYGFAIVVISVTAYVFYSRWLSAENYIRELNKINTSGYHESLKEYVTSLAIIKEHLSDIKTNVNK